MSDNYTVTANVLWASLSEPGWIARAALLSKARYGVTDAWLGLHGVRERDPVASLTLLCVADPFVLLRASEFQGFAAELHADGWIRSCVPG
ncbi:hypothetical protein WJX82_008315 [Trebouxia sp. C0006]